MSVPRAFATDIFDALPVMRELYAQLARAIQQGITAGRYTNAVGAVTSIMGLVEELCAKRIDGEQRRELVVALSSRLIRAIGTNVLHLDPTQVDLFSGTAFIDSVIGVTIAVSRGRVFKQAKKRCCR